MKKKNFLKNKFGWGWVVLGVSLLLNVYYVGVGGLPKHDESIAVEGVIDGDTLVLDGKVRLRLRHLDAPELEFCGGEEAKKLLEELVIGKRVIIRDKILDQRGRAMALVYVGKDLVNRHLIETGWGRYHSDTSEVADELKALGLEAKEKGLGVFGPKCYQWENSENPKCVIKGNVAPNNSSERIYHMPGCVQYKTTVVEKDRGEEWFCSEAEAKKAGYVKSKRC
ncbi:thermonuclease family protein [Patescibacteria group bacterium]|nr:thermonuclease family protein [Patescibacteria group bacterium]MBU1256727.1 thermonuclease family protein [Patescibacteria group bacterium]MBU1457212.1 thermonuclease family protein [Patescibacteria group bacterium]